MIIEYIKMKLKINTNLNKNYIEKVYILYNKI